MPDEKRIMICSVLNLTKEYSGITNVNCYLLFIDFDNNNIQQEYDFILDYIKEKCNINKKLYVLGIFNKAKDEDIYEQDILFQLYSKKFYFEYLHVNISDEQKVSEIIMNILLYCSQYPIYSDQEIEEKKTTKDYNYNYNENNDMGNEEENYEYNGEEEEINNEMEMEEYNEEMDNNFEENNNNFDNNNIDNNNIDNNNIDNKIDNNMDNNNNNINENENGDEKKLTMTDYNNLNNSQKLSVNDEDDKASFYSENKGNNKNDKMKYMKNYDKKLLNKIQKIMKNQK